MRTSLLSVLVFLLLFSRPLRAQEQQSYVAETDPLVLQRLEEWQDLKFGLLLTWGPYSQWGVVESWSICGEDEPWCQRKEGSEYVQYKKDYEALPKTFNPTKFDPGRWAKAAREAGIKYVLGMSKHCDGFCMFDTRTTDYRITHPSTPFSSSPKANVLKEILDAFRNEGIWPGIYYSKPDWHSDYYWWSNFPTPDRNVNYDVGKYPERWQKFVGFTHTQIDELMTGYGPLNILWLDGGWVQPMTREEILKIIASPDYKYMHLQNQDIRMPEMVRKARERQPGLIVVDRAVQGKYQNYMTPENFVPEKTQMYPWESCITATNSWSFTFTDRYKSSRELVHILVDIVSKGGNLLLNIGPGPDGTWAADAYDRLREMGEWLKVNGEAIYGTRAIAPYRDGKVCLTSKKDGSVFAIYLGDENEDAPPSKIWLNRIKPTPGAQLQLLGVKEPLRWEPVGNGFVVELPAAARSKAAGKYAWTIKISRLAR